MVTTLRDLVNDAKRELLGSNREKFATFAGWTGAMTGIELDGTPANLNGALVELDTELVYVTSIDANGVATCPAWFRQQNGTPANNSFAANSRVIVNPAWPAYTLARRIVEGINALYPSLYVVKEVNLTTSAINGNYEIVDTTIDGILHVTIEDYGPSLRQIPVGQWSLDTKNSDSKIYLRTNPTFPGRPLRVTYRAKPVVPDPSDLAATWTSTGFPDSASDLPVKYAVMCLLPSADASKTQTNAVEQSDRSKFVQGGSANSTSRRLQEIYQARLADERRKLLERYPVRLHKELNG